MVMRELLLQQFGSSSQLCDVILFYDETVGNSLSIQLRNEERPMMMENWVYLNTPVHVGRQPGKRSLGRMKVGAIGGWTKKNEQFIDTVRHRFLTIDSIPWESIPKYYEFAEQDMMAIGVPDPQLQMVMFSKVSGRLTATVIATTMGGGSSMLYEFDMDGTLVRPPR